MLIPSLWSKQPGRFFCISTRTEGGKWKDHFFSKDQFSEIRLFLKEHSDEDIYFCPHGFERRARQKEEAVLPKMCWADLDYVNPHNLTPRPTVALESSPGRYVGLWLTDEPVTESLNRRLTYFVEADKGGWDVTQVLRFPSTINYKYDTRPRVRVLWDDGPTYTIKKLEKYLPQEQEADEESDEDAAELYERYHKSFPGWLRRELMAGKPQRGKRSEMIWKIENELIECGVTQDEAFVLIKASPWNKFRGRQNEDGQLRRELEKAVGHHFKNFKPNAVSLKGAEKNQKRKQDEKEDTGEKNRFLLKSIAEVQEEELDWIWYPYLAKSELTILEGDPGLGKSYLAQMIGGCIVDGRSPPVVKPMGKKPIQGRVAYFDIENSAGSVTKRRLIDNKVKNMKDYFQEEVPFSIDDEDALDEIYEALEAFNPTLVVFDTLNTYIGKADTHKSSEVQQAFAHFRQIAKDFNCSVLVLRHLTKSKGGDKAIYRGQGSIAFTGLARVVMTVGQMPEDPNVRVMAVTKINVTKAPKAICFTIDELPNDRSRFVWGDFVDLTSDDILSFSPKNGKGKDSGDHFEECKDFLTEVLDDGPIAQDRLKRMGEKRGYAFKVITKAAEAIGIEKFHVGKGDRKELQWGLPE